MGASKTNHYTSKELEMALVARALSHPARIRILNILKTEELCRNIDLVSQLNLVQSTINTHIRKLKEANLITLDFTPNCYNIRAIKNNNVNNLFDSNNENCF